MSADHFLLLKLVIIWPEKALESSKAAAQLVDPYAFRCWKNSVRTRVKEVVVIFFIGRIFEILF
jgi:hypothetical protein